LKKLCKEKYKPIYGTVKEEITNFLETCNTLELVWEQNEFIDGNNIIRLNKIRLPNRLLTSGKSGGFRILIICNKGNDTITLLYIFPKVGPERMDNIGNNFKKELVKEYKAQLSTGDLHLSTFNKLKE
jgi:hypothetical protein